MSEEGGGGIKVVPVKAVTLLDFKMERCAGPEGYEVGDCVTMHYAGDLKASRRRRGWVISVCGLFLVSAGEVEYETALKTALYVASRVPPGSSVASKLQKTILENSLGTLAREVRRSMRPVRQAAIRSPRARVRQKIAPGQKARARKNIRAMVMRSFKAKNDYTGKVVDVVCKEVDIINDIRTGLSRCSGPCHHAVDIESHCQFGWPSRAKASGLMDPNPAPARREQLQDQDLD